MMPPDSKMHCAEEKSRDEQEETAKDDTDLESEIWNQDSHIYMCVECV